MIQGAAAPEYIAVIAAADAVAVVDINIGEAQIAAVAEHAIDDINILGDCAAHVDGQHRCVIGAGDGHSDGVGIGAAVAIIDRDIKAQGDGLADGEELHQAVGNVIAPAGVIDTEAGRQCILGGLIQSAAAPEYIAVIAAADAVAVVDINIGEAQIAAVAEHPGHDINILGDCAAHVDAQHRRIIGAGDGHCDGIGIGAAVAIIDRDIKAQGDGLADGEELHQAVGNLIAPAGVIDTEAGRQRILGGLIQGAAAPEYIAVIAAADAVAVVDIDIGEAQIAAVAEHPGHDINILGDRAAHVDAQHRCIIGAGDGHCDGIGIGAAVAIIDRDIKA